jgi:putative DNA primase/helicase
MSEYSLTSQNISPEEFLSAFFEPAETVCFRVFTDKKDTAFSGAKLEKQQGFFKKIEQFLRNHNDKGRGIFFVVNFGGHEDDEIKRINAQFVEMDNAPLDEQLRLVQSFALEPSLIVKTRKSLHCYWLMKKASVQKFRHIQKQLVTQFDGDPACVNESRVFRLPGFYHCKQEPIMVECIKFNPELRYTQEQLSELLPDVPAEPVSIKTNEPIHERGTQKGLVITGTRCLFLQHCKKNAKTLIEPDWYAMITNLAVFEGGESAIHKLSKPYPDYNYEQTQAKIEHFHKSGTKSMTCKKIAENGFICPRLHECKCKSPSAFAFFPLEVNQLTKALSSVKIKHESAANIEIAKEFINTYMYNFEPGLAEIFINNNIKAYFGFKNADIKGLPRFQKDLYRAFTSNQEARKTLSGKEIPPWYEVTRQGTQVFLPGALADYLAKTDPVINIGESYYFYENGVYNTHNDKTAQRRVRSLMDTRYATMADIRDSESQWQILVDKTVREINVNPYIINFSNGLYNVLTDELSPA